MRQLQSSSLQVADAALQQSGLHWPSHASRYQSSWNIWIRSFKIYGKWSVQASKHTHALLQCSHASVGLAQARPNQLQAKVVGTQAIHTSIPLEHMKTTMDYVQDLAILTCRIKNYTRFIISTQKLCLAGNFWGRKLLWISRFVAIRESFLREIWGRGVLWHGTSEQSTKVFSTKIVFFTNSWKFSASNVSCYMVSFQHNAQHYCQSALATSLVDH